MYYSLRATVQHLAALTFLGAAFFSRDHTYFVPGAILMAGAWIAAAIIDHAEGGK
jgi:hypothetical protein